MLAKIRAVRRRRWVVEMGAVMLFAIGLGLGLVALAAALDWRFAWSHPLAPLQILASYCHFAVIYRRSPVGLPVPPAFAALKMSDDDKAKLNTLLQQIAWDTVRSHPMAGVLAGKK